MLLLGYTFQNWKASPKGLGMNDDIETLYEDAMFALGDDDLDDATDTLNQMLEIAPDAPQTLEVQGDVARWREQPEEAERHYRRLLTSASDEFWKGVAHTSLASLWAAEGQNKSVREQFVLAVKAYRACDADDRALSVYAALASFDVEQGEFEFAAESLRSAVVLFEASDDADEMEPEIGTVQLMLGTCYRQQGKLDLARQTLNQALKLFQKLEEPDECANVLDALGVIEQIQGHYSAAEELHLKAVSMNEAIDFQEGLSTNYGNLTILNIHRGEWDQAANWAGRAYLIDKENEDENGVAHYHLLMGEIEFERGNLTKAEDHLQQALEMYQDCGDAEDMISVQGKTAVLYRQQGKLAEASEIDERILVDAERMGHGDGIAAILEDLAQVRKAQGRTEEARDFWQRSLAMYEQLGAERIVEEVRRELTEL